MANEQEVENMIIAAGKTGARITPAHIDSRIKHARYHRFPDTTTTVCCITLLNGMTVIGESACADPANFDERIGANIAFENAREKIWALEGYLLREKLHQSE
jgi:hypothetical protein